MTSLSDTKKRCPNGSRRNKKTNDCIKLPNIKVFENISDLKISETNNTLSVESLGEDGSIIKFYEKQILQSQILIKEEDIQKAKKNAHKDIHKLLKTMRNIHKDPSIIQKDTKFKKILRRVKGGTTKKNSTNKQSITPKDNNDIFIQEEVMTKLQRKDVVKLEQKIKQLNINESIFDKIWNTVGSHLDAIIIILKVWDIVGFSILLSQGIISIIFDLVGYIVVYILDIWYLYYPKEINENTRLHIKYIVYSILFTTIPWIGGIGLFGIPNQIDVFIGSSVGLGDVIYDNYKKSHINNKNTKKNKLDKTKEKLVDVLENPN
jgi:hypothetical protein